MATHQTSFGEIIHLNVGGKRFSTSKQTLTAIPDTFFTALLSGRVSYIRDENGAVFIDRDPDQFSLILNYLRTGEIDFDGRTKTLRTIRREAQYFNIAPLLERLSLLEELTQSTRGDALFYGDLPPPCVPVQQTPSAENPLLEATAVRPGSSANIRVPEGHRSATPSSSGTSGDSNGEGSHNGGNPVACNTGAPKANDQCCL